MVTVRLAVAIPAYNEAGSIRATLEALARQTDRDFVVVLTDNSSTDDTAAVASAAAEELGLGLTVVSERQKGTGAAADTAIRRAIADGATHVLRTDADTLPDPGWVAAGRRAFEAGADLITGPMRARTDEVRLKVWERTLLPGIVGFCQLFGEWRPSNRGPQFKGPYRMSPGCNLGVSAEIYEAAGGFPRTAIEDVHEDRELVNRVRRLSSRVEYHRELGVRASVRRLRAYGLLGTLKWYLNHSYTPTEVDVRTVSGGFDAADRSTTREARLLRAAHPGVAVIVDALLRGRRVRRVPGVGVLVADPKAVRAVLMDGESFKKSGRGSSGALWTPVLGESVLFNMDGPEHRALRRSVHSLFTPSMVRAVCERAGRPVLAAGLARLRRGETVDLARLSLEVAASVIADLIGLKDGMVTVIDVSSKIERLISWRSTELSAKQIAKARELVSVVGDAAAANYDHGDPATVMGRLRELGIDRDGARSLAIALFLSGTSTVSSGLPRIIDALGDRGALARGAWSTSGFEVDRVVAEGLRFTAPSLATLRRTAKATDIDGVAVQPGDRVLLLLWWAMRLEGGFDPGRTLPSDMRSLWFGAGPHFCLGAPLAIAELEMIVDGVVGVAEERGLALVRRTPARRVLLPRYDRFEVRCQI